MPKAIKAIECPKCGSTQKAAVRPDVFRCESCGTEYFLDNDDINVNYTVRQHAPPISAPATPRAVQVIIAAVVLLLVLVGSQLLFRQAAPPTTIYVAPPAPVPVPEAPKKYTFSSRQELLYLAPTQEPVLFQVGGRRYDGEIKDSSYALFRNAATNALLRSVALPIASGTSSPDIELKQFSNGDLYLLVDKTAVYRVDKTSYAVKDVTKSLFQGQAALTSGVATIEAGDDDYGDYFDLMTNDGRNLMYYPLIRKVYTEHAFYEAKHGFQTLQPRSPTRSAFTFSRKSTTYPEDKIQLIKYQYRDNGGGAKDPPRFEWSDDYGGSGIFTDADPHRKVLTTPHELQEARVLSYADFTPGRLYFKPQLLYTDTEYVLLSFKPTASPTAAVSVQCLNARTAAIIFTQPLPAATDPDRAVRYAKGFVLHDSDHLFTLSPSGQLTQHPDLP